MHSNHINSFSHFQSQILYVWGANHPALFSHQNHQITIPKKFKIDYPIEYVSANQKQIYILTKQGNVYKIMNKTLKIVNGLSNIIKIVNGINHFVALDLNGNVFAWGNNKRGCLGNQNFQSSQSPQHILIKQKVIDIVCGRYNTFFITYNRDVFCCGCNKSGQLGLRLLKNYLNPIKIQFGNKKIRQVSAGEGFTLFLTVQGQIYFCGNIKNNSKKKNQNENANKIQKIQSKQKFIQISASNYSAAISQNGFLYAWSNSIFANHKQPFLFFKNKKIKKVILKKDSGYAVDQDSEIWIWGKNQNDQLGKGERSSIIKPFKYPFFTNKICMSLFSGQNLMFSLIKKQENERKSGREERSYKSNIIDIKQQDSVIVKGLEVNKEQIDEMRLYKQKIGRLLEQKENLVNILDQKDMRLQNVRKNIISLQQMLRQKGEKQQQQMRVRDEYRLRHEQLLKEVKIMNMQSIRKQKYIQQLRNKRQEIKYELEQSKKQCIDKQRLIGQLCNEQKKWKEQREVYQNKIKQKSQQCVNHHIQIHHLKNLIQKHNINISQINLQNQSFLHKISLLQHQILNIRQQHHSQIQHLHHQQTSLNNTNSQYLQSIHQYKTQLISKISSLQHAHQNITLLSNHQIQLTHQIQLKLQTINQLQIQIHKYMAQNSLLKHKQHQYLLQIKRLAQFNNELILHNNQDNEIIQKQYRQQIDRLRMRIQKQQQQIRSKQRQIIRLMSEIQSMKCMEQQNRRIREQQIMKDRQRMQLKNKQIQQRDILEQQMRKQLSIRQNRQQQLKKRLFILMEEYKILQRNGQQRLSQCRQQLSNRLSDKQSIIKSLNDQILNQKQQYSSNLNLYIHQYNQKESQYKTIINQLQLQHQLIIKSFNSLTQTNLQLKQSNLLLSQQITQLSHNIYNLQSSLTNLKIANHQMSSFIKQSQLQLSNHHKKWQCFQSILKNKQKQILSLSQHILKNNNTQTTHTSQIHDLLQKIRITEINLNKSQKQSQALKQINFSLNKNLQQKDTMIQQLNQKIRKTVANHNLQLLQYRKFKEKCSTYQQILNQKQETIQQLNQQILNQIKYNKIIQNTIPNLNHSQKLKIKQFDLKQIKSNDNIITIPKSSIQKCQQKTKNRNQNIQKKTIISENNDIKKSKIIYQQQNQQKILQLPHKIIKIQKTRQLLPNKKSQNFEKQ